MTAGVPGYTKELHKVIVDHVREGRPKSLAFRLAVDGLTTHPETIWDWCHKGRHDPKRYPHYAQLVADIEHARAEAEAEALGRIKSAAKADPKHWTADAWFLERTNPEEFAKRDKVAIETGGSPLVQLNQVVLMDGEARAKSRDLIRVVTGLAVRSADAELAPGDVVEESVDDVE